jgi:RHS repeat-associated protein
VLGGLGASGNVIATAELFDTATSAFKPLATPGLTPRAYHTATLLTDGTVLVAGGTASDGEVLRSAELWDPEARSATLLAAEVNTPRRNHLATLLPSGKVLLWGGASDNGEPLANSDLYDPETSSFAPVDTQPTEAQVTSTGPSLTASIPEDRAQNVAVSSHIALRFSEPLQVKTVNVGTAVLQGPEGQLTAKVVPAEGGMLAFVTPQEPLLPDTTYTLSLDALADPAGRALPAAQIAFTTAGPAAPLDDETWIPGSSNWRTGRPDSPWRKLSPLQAPPGTTAIAGQVLKLNGEPLANVTLEVDKFSTRSDSTGRFLLILGSGMSGHCVLVINGASANKPGKTYGLFQYGMNVKPGITNVLPFTIWMPLIDMAHAITIPSPTRTETTITTPLLPGLELRLPAGTVIYDYEGHVSRTVSVTPIPLDRTPFPLPNVQVPIYFTIQPGGAWLKFLNPSGPHGAQLIYPNTYHSPPGTVYDFWNYEADDKGWYIYGHGRVSSDRLHIVPDPGVVIYEFTGAMVGNPDFAPPNGPAPNCGGGPNPGPLPSNPSPINPQCGDPIDLGTGLFVHTETDLTLPDVIPIALTRTYRPNDSRSRAFGIGATHPYDIFLVGNVYSFAPYIDLILPDGGRLHFPCIQCDPSNPANSVFEHTSSPTSFYGAKISYDATKNQWVLKKKDGTAITFPIDPTTIQQAAVTSLQDRFGNALIFTRDSNSNLTKIATPNGHYIQFTLDSNNRITQATDNIGRTVKYVYDTAGRLSTVTDANGGTTTYSYDGSNNMVAIKDAREITRVNNEYDSNNRVTKQTLVDGSTYQISYTLDGQGNVSQATETDPRKNIRQVTFDSKGYVTSDTKAVGTPQQELTTYNRDSDGTELVFKMVDALSRTTAYTYDALGNVTSITRLYGTPNATTTSFMYDPTFSQVTKITDPLGHATLFDYDSVGNLKTLADPLNHQWTFTYNTQGQVLSATDPLSNTMSFTYSDGNLASITDPLARITILARDGGGRLLSLQDPAGAITQYQYDPLGDLTSTTDPLGNITSFAYDQDRNLTSLTDALGHSTNYTYDKLDRLSTHEDPLKNTESYTYDLAGNVHTFTDRKKQKTTFTYDPLNRRTKATYTDGSSASYTYDAGNRLTQAKDSVSGSISRKYDGLDRLTSETTPQGNVTYAYDKASRRAKMTVAGQPAIDYFYDDANRLLSITQGGTSKVSLAYDKANRRTALTLPNGVTTNYSYDKASELTGLTYTLGSTTLGNLTYTYDNVGRRTSVGGTYARTGLPQAVASATYNADNQLTQWGSSSLNYDLNGNLTNDGTNTYTWNARNQLASINSGTTASFQYDGFGRRQTKTVSGASTSFLYDGINPVQELSGAAATANLVTGLAVDEIFSRTDSAGARYFLSDALHSTLALTDPTGTLQTQYTYEPFGNTTVSGAASGNSYQYTGRENDDTGLYYYRARFYNAAIGRFISEDPIRFGSADVNLYRYANDDPENQTDPFGLLSIPGCIWGVCIGVVVFPGPVPPVKIPGWPIPIPGKPIPGKGGLGNPGQGKPEPSPCPPGGEKPLPGPGGGQGPPEEPPGEPPEIPSPSFYPPPMRPPVLSPFPVSSSMAVSGAPFASLPSGETPC